MLSPNLSTTIRYGPPPVCSKLLKGAEQKMHDPNRKGEETSLQEEEGEEEYDDSRMDDSAQSEASEAMAVGSEPTTPARKEQTAAKKPPKRYVSCTG
jgi:hypothetical protein